MFSKGMNTVAIETKGDPHHPPKHWDTSTVPTDHMCPMRYVSVYDRWSFGSERWHENGAGTSCDGIPVIRRSCDLELVYGDVYCLSRLGDEIVVSV